MPKYKSSIIAVAFLVILVGVFNAVNPLLGIGQEVGQFGRRGNFYLTRTRHNGAEALTACARGYHMASIFEIFDPSNLKYDTFLGFMERDSALGPPHSDGWIRTGWPVANGGGGDEGNQDDDVPNCFTWTSANASHLGTSVTLQRSFHASFWSPWSATHSSCSSNKRVWCVQD